MTLYGLIARFAFPAKPMPFRPLAMAAICTLAALGLRLALEPLLHGGVAWMPFWPAVLIASVCAGEAAGALAIGLSVAAGWLLILPLVPSFSPYQRLAGMVVFVLLSAVGVAVGSALRRALGELRSLLASREATGGHTEASEARLKLAQEVAGLGLFDWDIANGGAYFSEGFLKNWGLDDAGAPNARDDLITLIHPEDREAVRTASDAALAAGAIYESEYRIVRPSDGEIRWLHVRGEVLRDEDGKARRLIGVNQDVTDRKTAEAALRESEARFREMADSAPAPVWVTDAEARVLFANQAMMELGGFENTAVLGHSWLDVLHPEDRDRVMGERQAAIAEGHRTYEVEARYRDAAGRWRRLRTISRPRVGSDGAFLGYVGIAFDVTEMRESEAALKESEARFRAMADSADAPIWVTDAPGGIVFGNQALEEFLGITLAEVSGDGWQKRMHPDDLPDMEARRADPRERREPYVFEARFRDALDRWRWLRAYSRPRFGPDGAFLGYVGIGFDVTEIRRSEQQLKVLFDQAGVGMARADQDQRIELANERFALMLGGAPEDIIGRTIEEITWKGDLTPTRKNLEGLTEGRPYAQVKRYVRLDGEPVWASSSVTPVFDDGGQPAGSVCVAVDLTQARRAEAALRESEQRFRLIADSAPVLMWVSALGGKREFVNRAYAEFIGMTYEDAVKFDWRGRIHQDDVERILKEQIEGEGSHRPFVLEARYRRHDDQWRWLRSFSQPRPGPDGEHIGFIGVAFDVTEAKQAADDLRRINDLLEERVTAALEQKEVAEAALLHAQKIEAVGRLTGGVAHDFNNLLTVVIGALDMILKAPDDAKRRQRMAEAAMAAARRGERLTHQLLAFSRRQALRPEVLDANQLLRESEPLLRRAIGESVDFALQLDDEAIVKVDPGQLEAALLNLVVNARDATPSGGSIRVESAVTTIDDRRLECDPGRYVWIRVSDSGEGMEPGTAARAFEPFFTTKPVGKGTGLGLSQVYGFARQSGGAVEIDSRPGEGARITIYLPVADQPLEVGGVRLQPGAPVETPSLRVLLVEDDAAVAAIAEAMLKDLGHTVHQADSPEPALVWLRGPEPFDLLLTDVIMPGAMNGVQLAREAVTLRPGLEVVLTSGYAGDAIDDALTDAPWPFLKKPYAEPELARILQPFGRAKAPAR